MVLRLYLLSLSVYSSQSAWWYADFPYTHCSLRGGPQTIPIHITVSLVALRLSLYTPQSPWFCTTYPYIHHSLPGGTQIIPIIITNSLVRHCFSSKSLWLETGSTQTILILITVFLVLLGLSLYSSQSPWWFSDYPYHSLLGGPQSIPIHIKVSLVVLRLSLYTSQSL